MWISLYFPKLDKILNKSQGDGLKELNFSFYNKYIMI